MTVKTRGAFRTLVRAVRDMQPGHIFTVDDLKEVLTKNAEPQVSATALGYIVKEFKDLKLIESLPHKGVYRRL